jgi:hypothetical protein
VDTLAEVVEASVRALDLKPQDAGAAALAVTYARRIDEGDDPKAAGPLLLAALEALLMTPRARAALLKGGTDERRDASPLDELRIRREQRGAA